MSRSFFQAPQARDLQQRLSVRQLNARARQLLEQGLAQVWVEGEISNFVASAAGHWYFTLKDARAQLSCVMFSGRNQLSLHRPKNGDQVQLRGQVSLYEGRGQYQLLAEELRLSGEGDFLARLEQLKKKLQAEGLFSAERKRPLPTFPQCIGLITSLQGAALRDLLHVLNRRWPLAEILIYPAQVQGAEAPASLRRALAQAQYHGQPEVLVLARGGGSLEDLQAFNDETLARMVTASAMPVVTGVGHETDFTLVDFVSDLRAPTPSAAAEAVTPDKDAFLDLLHSYQGRLTHAQASSLRRWQQQLDSLALRAANPQPLLEGHKQLLGRVYQRLLAQHPQRRLEQQRHLLQQLEQRLHAASPLKVTRLGQPRLKELQARLSQANQRLLTNHQQRLEQLAARLHAMSPLQTLARGYALVKNTEGQVIGSSDQVKVGAAVEIKLAKGALLCRVEQTKT
ncbi:Exodeoxyribonuclease VII large subunit [Marinospirillum celere]|uniref:Exodeoxyribonuclease 7 large subunit n=1 Tax=Marinospirillum celere TaxID=1122252 RepID=A0A1I1I6R5_9GAMM|nr:exodeoxyribonuclease VII large subunit [Marinospirillum celere]SFC31502.1 Exodeoxyribonuclease VII large subunit [Marinospirillum celere]